MPLDATRQRALRQNLFFNLLGVFFGLILIGYGAYQLNIAVRSRFLRPIEKGQARLLTKELLPYESGDERYKMSFSLTNEGQKTHKLALFNQDLFGYLDRQSSPTQKTFHYVLAKHPTKKWVFMKFGNYRHKPKPLATSAWILMLGIVVSGFALIIAAFRSVKERKRQLAFEQLLAENESRRQAKKSQPTEKTTQA